MTYLHRKKISILMTNYIHIPAYIYIYIYIYILGTRRLRNVFRPEKSYISLYGIWKQSYYLGFFSNITLQWVIVVSIKSGFGNQVQYCMFSSLQFEIQPWGVATPSPSCLILFKNGNLPYFIHINDKKWLIMAKNRIS